MTFQETLFSGGRDFLFRRNSTHGDGGGKASAETAANVTQTASWGGPLLLVEGEISVPALRALGAFVALVYAMGHGNGPHAQPQPRLAGGAAEVEIVKVEIEDRVKPYIAFD